MSLCAESRQLAQALRLDVGHETYLRHCRCRCRGVISLLLLQAGLSLVVSAMLNGMEVSKSWRYQRLHTAPTSNQSFPSADLQS